MKEIIKAIKSLFIRIFKGYDQGHYDARLELRDMFVYTILSNPVSHFDDTTKTVDIKVSYVYLLNLMGEEQFWEIRSKYFDEHGYKK